METFLIVVGCIMVVSYFFKQFKDCKCASCGWVGSNSRWSEFKGCPNCRSDRKVKTD